MTIFDICILSAKERLRDLYKASSIVLMFVCSYNCSKERWLCLAAFKEKCRKHDNHLQEIFFPCVILPEVVASALTFTPSLRCAHFLFLTSGTHRRIYIRPCIASFKEIVVKVETPACFIFSLIWKSRMHLPNLNMLLRKPK